jgi:signal transduction histidine kinase
MPTSSRIEREIIERLGFFPAFFAPALPIPKVLEKLWQQTQSAYIKNPLPYLFKEKLFVYLSRHCSVPYFAICHSCALHSLGVTAQEILELNRSSLPNRELDLNSDLQELSQNSLGTFPWQHNPKIEKSILRCSGLLFLQPFQGELCRTVLGEFLGMAMYDHLIALLHYIKLCHQWLECNPEISYKKDLRAQLHLASLLSKELELARLFQPKVLIKTINNNGCDCPTTKVNLGKYAQNMVNLESDRFKAKDSSPQSRQSPAFAEYLLDCLPYYLFVVERETQQISFCNQLMAKGLGFDKPQQVQGKTIVECFSPENANKLFGDNLAILELNQPLRQQEAISLADGHHYFHTEIIPLNKPDGEIHSLLYTLSDVPDLVATKKALSKRTAQLEAANKELESFSYSVSHDLQTPLRVINGFSEVLWERHCDKFDQKEKHYLERIRANSKRMSELIDALLQLSQITRSQMHFTTVDLSAIATEIAAELQNSQPDRQVELKITPGLVAYGDRSLLRVVINNLLNNAWKYTSKRMSALIEFDAIASPEQPLTYLIKDNGVGFDPTYAGKLFIPFQRFHSEAEFPGTGIGLATVQRIIYRHGGRVWAEGNPEQGAVFYFSL